MFISFNPPVSKNLQNVQKTAFTATTTATNAVILESGQYCHIQNEADSVAFVAVGTAATNAASATTAFWKIPANSDVYFEDVPIGQLNVVLASGTGNVNFVVADRS
jgi:hypothetical protein